MDAFDAQECIVCGKATVQRCSACKKLYFCSQEHQKLIWRTHKVLCGHDRFVHPPVTREELKEAFENGEADIMSQVKMVIEAGRPHSLQGAPFLDVCEAFDRMQEEISAPLRVTVRTQCLRVGANQQIPHLYDAQTNVTLRPFLYATAGEVMLSVWSPQGFVNTPPAQSLLCRLLYHYALVSSYDLSTEGDAGAVHAEHLRSSYSRLQVVFNRVSGAGRGPSYALEQAKQAMEQVLAGRDVRFGAQM